MGIVQDLKARHHRFTIRSMEVGFRPRVSMPLEKIIPDTETRTAVSDAYGGDLSKVAFLGTFEAGVPVSSDTLGAEDLMQKLDECLGELSLQGAQEYPN